MSLPVWGIGIPSLFITWGLGRDIQLTSALDTVVEAPPLPMLEIVITPLEEEIQFEEIKDGR